MSGPAAMRRPARGFGLVELMVALVLGLLLVAAAIQVFLSVRATQQYNQALAEVQDGARFAMHQLTHDLRLAGYSGCPAVASRAPSVVAGSPYGTVRVIAQSAVDQDIRGADLGTDALMAPEDRLPGTAAADSDAIRLAYMRDYGVRVTGPAAALSATLKVNGNPGNWEAEDLLLVTDCRQADLFAATSVSASASGPWINIAHASNHNSDNKLSKIYDSGARVLEPYAAVYYVRDDGGGLFRKSYFARSDAQAVIQEMVPGISRLSIRYGVDTDGDRRPDAYRAAGAVAAAQWPRIVAVRLGFIIASETRIGEGAGEGELTLHGESVDVPEDGRMRQVFSRTVALRNRVP